MADTSTAPMAVDQQKASLDQVTQALLRRSAAPQAGGMAPPMPRSSPQSMTPQGYNLQHNENSKADTGQVVQNIGTFVHNMVAQHKQNQVRDAMAEWQGFNMALEKAQVLAGDPSAPDYQKKVQQMLGQDPWVKANLDPANPKAQKRLKNMYKALNVDLLEGDKDNVHRDGLKRFFQVQKAYDKVKQAGQALAGHKQQPPPMDPAKQGEMMQQGLGKLMVQQTFKPPDMREQNEAARTAVDAKRVGQEKWDFKQGVGPDGKPEWFAFDKTNPNVPAKPVQVADGDGKLSTVGATAKGSSQQQGKVLTIEGAPYGVVGPQGVVTPSDPEFAKGLPNDPTYYGRKMNDSNHAYAKAEANKQKLAGIRAETYVKSRYYAVIDNQSGQMVMKNAEELAKNPSGFAPAGMGMQAMQKDAIFNDIDYNIKNVSEAAEALSKTPTGFNAGVRAKMLLALASNEPKDTVHTLISSGALGTLTDAQQDYLVAVASLQENGMALRSVAGLGQGSEDVRNAIRAVLPGVGAPNIQFIKKQITKVQGVVDRLHKGLPSVIQGNAISDPNAVPDAN